MPDNIPFEIHSEIMRRLPVKSLIQFRSVCKTWKSLIESSDFIKHYTSQQQHLLIRYDADVNPDLKYVSVVDDDDDDDNSFPQVTVTIPQLVVNMHRHYYDCRTVGSSHGLLCVFSGDLKKVVIWNPCISKAVDVTAPNIADNYFYGTFLGFWVCHESKDPKIVKITTDVKGENPWQVEVFTLSTNAWRGSYNTNLPRRSIYICQDQVVVGGCLYWLACDPNSNMDDATLFIISFDTTSEEVGEVNLPDTLAHSIPYVSICKLRESLVVIQPGAEDRKQVFHVWMMEDGAAKSFQKLYTIGSLTPGVSILCVLGFKKTGEPLIKLDIDRGATTMLATYEPNSKSISNIYARINWGSFAVYSYMETLILL